MQIGINTTESNIEVTSPYDGDFVRRCRQLGGKWNGATKAWRFPIALKDDVLQALNDCYGYVVDAKQERVTLKVTLHQQLRGDQEPVKFGPYELAKAWGRDSGAKPGPNVALISGRITSGGSRKNWSSYADAGCVFKLTEVPISVAERLREIAVEEKFTAYVRADEVVRQLVDHEYPNGLKTQTVPDNDGRPDGYKCERDTLKGTYYWLRPVTKQIFTVEEV